MNVGRSCPAPKRYAAAKKQNAGNGSAYPDGFTVKVTDSDQGDAPLSLPLAISTALESDPKAIEDFPEKAKLNSEMEAIVDPDGKFVVKNDRIHIRLAAVPGEFISFAFADKSGGARGEQFLNAIADDVASSGSCQL